MKILVLGGGISGLSAAWFLRQKYPTSQITLLEKQHRLGGWIQTGSEKGILFEKGPRTFAYSRSPHLLKLIQDVGLEKELMASDPKASRRYLWSRGKLKGIASFWPSLVSSFIYEPFQSCGKDEDESVYAFAKRRFGSKIAETFCDALTVGIYGEHSRELSMRSCFPSLFAMEKKWGSLCLPLLFSKKTNKKKGLFTLRCGMDALIRRLQEASQADIFCDHAVEEIYPDYVVSNGKRFAADCIVSALPGQTIGRLSYLWNSFPQTDLWVANLAYAGDVLPKKGFGYLVPSKEKENVLGMVWDSKIFPEQSVQGVTRLSVMMREGSAEAAKEIVRRHLQIKDEPLFAYAYFAKGAIPRFIVGYDKLLKRFEHEMKTRFPKWILLGNFLRKGPSVESCVATAHEKVQSL